MAKYVETRLQGGIVRHSHKRQEYQIGKIPVKNLGEKVRKWEVLGIPVTEDLFREYYGGDGEPAKQYNVDGAELSLYAVQECARGDLGFLDPQIVIDSRTVLKGIQKEIITKMKKENFYMAKKHNDFKGYVEELKTNYDVRLKNYVEAEETYSQKRDTFVGLKTENSRNFEAVKYYDAQLTILDSDYKSQKEKAQEDIAEVVNSIRSELEKHLKEFYSVASENLDRNEIDLLESGMLTDEELEEHAEKYRDNVTMLRRIGSHVSKMTGDKMKELAHKLSPKTLGGGAHELKAYDLFAEYVVRSFSNDSVTARVNRQFTEKKYIEAIADLEATYAQPVFPIDLFTKEIEETPEKDTE